MQSFMQYLCESHFEKEDFSKVDNSGELKYVKRVIQHIVDDGVIELGDKEATEKIQIPPKVRDVFSKYLEDTSKLTHDKFNQIIGQVMHKNSKGKDEPIRWSLIFKGQYSLTGGGQDAKYAEAATAYCYNVLTGKTNIKKSSIKGESESDDVVMVATKQVLQAKGIDPKWIKSSQLTAKKIKMMTTSVNDYVAAHVDGNDISEIPENVKVACKVFTGKEGITDVFGQLVTPDAVENLYPSTQKDMWNKADIVLIDSKLNIIDMLRQYLKANSIKQLTTQNDINNYINSLIIGNKNDRKFKCKGHYIIPISLKGIVIRKNTTEKDIAFEADGKLANPKELTDITTVKIELPTEVKDAEKKVFNGSCYLRTNNGLQLTFRNKEPTKESLLIEIQLKGARGGNGLGLLRNKLNLGNGFYKNILNEVDPKITTEDAYVKKIEELIGQKITVPDSLRKSTAKSTNNWFQRSAYKGLLCFLLKYREQIQGTTTGKVDLVNMFRMMYRCASGADSESIYWLVKSK